MEQFYCIITGGKEKTMKIRLLLRLLNLLILAIIEKLWGIDWVIIVGLVIVVSDIDRLADAIEHKLGKDCK